MLTVTSILEIKFEKSSASVFAAAKRNRRTRGLASGSVAWPGSDSSGGRQGNCALSLISRKPARTVTDQAWAAIMSAAD
jgi:hypothetical protein